MLEREEIHLILSDVRLRKEQTGIDLATRRQGEGRSDPVRDRPCLPERAKSPSAA